MTLASCEAKGWLHQHSASKDEILSCLSEAESDLVDARRDLAPAWCFSLTCAAALNLCNVLLHASGYRSEDQSSYHAVHVLPMILGETRDVDVDYLASCLQHRYQKKPQQAQSTTLQQANDLLLFTEELYLQVVDWLRQWDPALLEKRSMPMSHDSYSDSDWLISL